MKYLKLFESASDINDKEIIDSIKSIFQYADYGDNITLSIRSVKDSLFDNKPYTVAFYIDITSDGIKYIDMGSLKEEILMINSYMFDEIGYRMSRFNCHNGSGPGREYDHMRKPWNNFDKKIQKIDSKFSSISISYKHWSEPQFRPKFDSDSF